MGSARAGYRAADIFYPLERDTVQTRRAILLGAAGLGASAVLDVFWLEPHWLEVSEIDWPIAGLPYSLEGFRIGHVTDVHIDGRLSGREEGLLSALRRARCNLVAMTGDMLNAAADLPALEALARAIAQVAPATVATYGNWEHWADIEPDDLRARYARTGVRLLVNEGLLVEGLRLFATDDAYVGHARPDLAARELRAGEPSFLLTHSPGMLESIPPAQFSGVLSGHTHGGQVRIGGAAPFVPPGSGRFVAGAYRTPYGPAYVSRGIGTSLVAGRFACRPELPILTLRRA